jgi:hypothetical protein
MIRFWVSHHQEWFTVGVLKMAVVGACPGLEMRCAPSCRSASRALVLGPRMRALGKARSENERTDEARPRHSPLHRPPTDMRDCAIAGCAQSIAEHPGSMIMGSSLTHSAPLRVLGGFVEALQRSDNFVDLLRSKS